MVARRTGGLPRAPDTDNPCTLIGYFLPAKISVPLPMYIQSLRLPIPLKARLCRLEYLWLQLNGFQ